MKKEIYNSLRKIAFFLFNTITIWNSNAQELRPFVGI